MRRLIVVPTGVLLAFVGSSLALAIGLLAEVMRLPLDASLGLAWIAAALQADTVGRLGLGLSAVWTALVASCLVPVSLVATIGEAAQIRSFLWSAGGTGILTTAMPSLLRGLTRLPADVVVSAREERLTVLLFGVGLVAGTIYWLVAGARDRRCAIKCGERACVPGGIDYFAETAEAGDVAVCPMGILLLQA